MDRRFTEQRIGHFICTSLEIRMLEILKVRVVTAWFVLKKNWQLLMLQEYWKNVSVVAHCILGNALFRQNRKQNVENWFCV